MVTLFKLALVIIGLVVLCVILADAEAKCENYGCFKMSPANCSNCKKKCKWKYILKDYEETED